MNGISDLRRTDIKDIITTVHGSRYWYTRENWISMRFFFFFLTNFIIRKLYWILNYGNFAIFNSNRFEFPKIIIIYLLEEYFEIYLNILNSPFIYLPTSLPPFPPAIHFVSVLCVATSSPSSAYKTYKMMKKRDFFFFLFSILTDTANVNILY